MNNKLNNSCLILIVIALWLQVFQRYAEPGVVMAQNPTPQRSVGSTTINTVRLADTPVDVRVVNQPIPEIHPFGPQDH
jgi:hypothetical protein